MDILGPFPMLKASNRYVLVIIDQFTKWLECLVLPDQTAARVAEALVSEVIARLGCPFQIHTDQGTNFQSDLFRAVCDLMKIAQTRTTPYRPSSNGQAERMNTTLLAMIRCFIKQDPQSWDTLVPQLTGAIRATPNRSTGFTPNLMMLGREVSSPADVVLASVAEGEDATPSEFVAGLVDRLDRVHHASRKFLRRAQEVQKRNYDLRLAEQSYSEGDLVFALNTSRTQGVGSKLRQWWQGPFLVVEVLSPVLYCLRCRRKEFVLHHDRLKRCKDRIVPVWLRRLRKALQEGALPPVGVMVTSDTPQADLDVSLLGATPSADANLRPQVTTGSGKRPRLAVDPGEYPRPTSTEQTQPEVRTRAGRISKLPSRFGN
jgi:hypothetical protein